jgi:hypothetical protein
MLELGTTCFRGLPSLVASNFSSSSDLLHITIPTEGKTCDFRSTSGIISPKSSARPR